MDRLMAVFWYIFSDARANSAVDRLTF